MRYSLFLLLSIVLLAAILAGCGSLGPEQETIGSPEKSISSASEQDKQTLEASGTEAMDTPQSTRYWRISRKPGRYPGAWKMGF